MENYSEIKEFTNLSTSILLDYCKWFTSSKFHVYSFKSFYSLSFMTHNKIYKPLYSDISGYFIYVDDRLRYMPCSKYKCVGAFINAINEKENKEFIEILPILIDRYGLKF